MDTSEPLQGATKSPVGNNLGASGKSPASKGPCHLAYANFTAHGNNQTNCYVSSRMPTSATHNGVYADALEEEHQACLLRLSTHPGTRAPVHFSRPLNITHLTSPVTQNNCSMLKNILGWPQLKDPLMIKYVAHGYSHSLCFTANRTVKGGAVPLSSCKKSRPHAHIYTQKLSRLSLCLESTATRTLLNSVQQQPFGKVMHSGAPTSTVHAAL